MDDGAEGIGKDFEYDFSQWPDEFWLDPKFDTVDFNDILEKVNLTQLTTLINTYYEYEAWVDVTVRVKLGMADALLTKRNIAFAIPNPYLGMKTDAELAEGINERMAKLPKGLQGGTIERIVRIRVRAGNKEA